MKQTEIHLVTIPNNPNRLSCEVTGNTDDLAKMLVAGLTYHPELLKKTFKGILEKGVWR